MDVDGGGGGVECAYLACMGRLCDTRSYPH